MKTAVTLFCGGGVADAGLIAAGFTIIAAVEREEWIAQVYRQNYGDHIINAAVGDVDFTPYKGVDLVFGSAPCQNFSQARSRDLPEHKDSNVTREAIVAIATMQPRWIIWENVPAYRKSPQYAELREFLFGQGYWLNEQVINCVDYDVPQNRKRFILLATKDGTIPQMPQKEKRCGWYSAIADLINDCPKTQPAKWQLSRLPKDFCDNVLLNWGMKTYVAVESDASAPTLTCRKENLLAVLVPRVGFRGDKIFPILPNLPSPTLRALGHNQQSRQFDLVVDGDWRILLPRCEARLQTLPDEYQLPSARWKAKRIIGNGFPSLAMQKIAAQFTLSSEVGGQRSEFGKKTFL